MRRRTAGGRRVVRALVVSAVCVAVFTLGCQPAAEQASYPRVLFIGVDGLDWDRMTRLADEGQLPNIAALMDEGSSGVLHSIYPYLSPSIWTSIATGKKEEQHGIVGFLVDRGRTTNATPTSSNMWKARAVWKILNDAGQSAGVIGWLVTWPAEPVSGYMISSRLSAFLRDRQPEHADAELLSRMRSAIYPEGLWDDIVESRVDAQDISDDDIASFLDTPVPESEDAEAAIAELRRTYAFDLTTLAMARRFFTAVPTDLAAVYLRGLDLNCHTYWKYMEPETWPHELSDDMVSAFRPVIESYYAHVDEMVGELLEHRGAETIVVLCSDHGFAGHAGYPGFDGEFAVGVS
ncbi:alkaline phosphatase family protein, partial [bacterium]|nr:alkaline phosphatase family protein [bacterium]